MAQDYWPHFDSHYYQINLISQEPYRFCNLVYALARSMVAPDDVDRFEFELSAPLPGQSKKISDASAEEEGQAFMALMTQMKGGTRGSER